MKSGKVVLLAMAMMAVSNAKTLQIGGRNLEVLAPEGFVEVTPEMPKLYEIARGIVDPDNPTLAYFIPADMADAAKAGENVELKKYFLLKVQGNTEFVSLDSAGFAGLVAEVKSSNFMINQEMKTQLGDDFSLSAVVKLRGIAAHPPHLESDVVFAYSMLTSGRAFGSDDQNQIMSATTAYTNVAGKILLLSAFAEEGELEWTRDAVGAWSSAVLASNPKAPVGNAGGGNSKSEEDIDSIDIKSGVIGAVIGVALAVLFLVIKRR